MLFASCALFAGASCNVAADQEEVRVADVFARESIEALRTQGAAGLRPRLHPNTAKLPNMNQAVAEMTKALPRSTPDSVMLVHGDISVDRGVSTSKLVYTVHGADANARVDIWIVRYGGTSYVETIRVSALP